MELKKTLVYFFLLLIFSCNIKNTKEILRKNESYKNYYAIGFTIEKIDNYKKIVVFNPWQNAKNQKYEYFLVNKLDSSTNLIADNIIKIPVEKVICLSTTHIGFLNSLNTSNSIVAISGVNYIYDSTLNEMIKQNKIVEIGYENNINIEKIIELKPDIIFAYDITGALLSKFEYLKKLGIQVVIVGEYLENSPLGRAEWIKFFGAFFEKDSLANSIFDNIDKKYNNLIQKTNNTLSKSGVVINIPFQGIWFVPGGDSYLAKIIEDAGGNYLWKNNKNVESFSVSFEDVFAKNDSIFYLLNPSNTNSIQEIIKTDKRLNNLNCIRNSKVFNNNKRSKKNGGNDFWESGIINPHLILKDLIFIFNFEVVNEDSLFYYQKLQ